MDLHYRWVYLLSLLAAILGSTGYTEGLVTAVASVFLYLAISDFPEEVKWLTQEEKAFVKRRLLDDVGDSGHHVKYGVRDVLGVFKDREYFA